MAADKEWNDLLEARLIRAEARQASIEEQVEEITARLLARMGLEEPERAPTPTLTVIEGGHDA